MTDINRDPGSGGLPTEDVDPTPRSGGDVVTGDGTDAGPIADRLGRNPGNLGDEVPAAGDITHPTPEPGGAQM